MIRSCLSHHPSLSPPNRVKRPRNHDWRYIVGPQATELIRWLPLLRVAKQVVAERMAALANDKPLKMDMLGSFLAHGLTRDEAEGETLVQIIAGSDTTATAMRATLLHLLSNPTAYAALTHEVRTAAREGRISSPVTDAESRAKLPYLQAVVREGLRVWPPVAGLMSVTVPPGGDIIHGLQIPEGTEIGWAAYGVLHDAAVFGPDAAVFRPERWLDADPERLKAMLAQADFVFKYGKWQCLGKTIAQIELNKIFVEVRTSFGAMTLWCLMVALIDYND